MGSFTPNINRCVVFRYAKDQLWSTVVAGNDIWGVLSEGIDHFRASKVTDFNFLIVVDQYVLRLEISVSDIYKEADISTVYVISFIYFCCGRIEDL